MGTFSEGGGGGGCACDGSGGRASEGRGGRATCDGREGEGTGGKESVRVRGWGRKRKKEGRKDGR